ncbi:hypothetical protein [Agarivorans litoreus]|nr:hypothetical protein [Agarivorans litoreus]
MLGTTNEIAFSQDAPLKVVIDVGSQLIILTIVIVTALIVLGKVIKG